MPTLDPAQRNLKFAKLWGGVFSGALGAEAFSISILWLLVKALGTIGAYYLSVLLLGAIISGIIGAGMFDGFRPFRAAAITEAMRAVAGVTAFLSVVNGWSITVLIGAGLVLAAVRPHQSAAVFGGLSTLRLDEGALQKSNALVESSYRFARIAGPAVVAAIAVLAGEKVVLLFVCGCFLVAMTLWASLDSGLSRSSCSETASAPHREKARFLEALTRGAKLAIASPLLVFCFVSQAVNSGAWYLAFVFSTALLLSEGGDTVASGLGNFGTAMLFYGLGSITSILIVGMFPIERPLFFVVAGRGLAGVGYMLMAVDLGFTWLCLCAAITAVGTPPADLAFLRAVQARHAWDDVAKLCRMKLVNEYLGMLIGMLTAPALLEIIPPQGVIAGCGLALIACALAGARLRTKELRIQT